MAATTTPTHAKVVPLPGAAVGPVINPRWRGRYPKGVVSATQLAARRWKRREEVAAQERQTRHLEGLVRFHQEELEELAVLLEHYNRKGEAYAERRRDVLKKMDINRRYLVEFQVELARARRLGVQHGRG